DHESRQCPRERRHEPGEKHAEVARDTRGEKAPERRVRLTERAVDARQQERQYQRPEHQQPGSEELIAAERQHESACLEGRERRARDPYHRVPKTLAEGLDEHYRLLGMAAISATWPSKTRAACAGR